MRVRDSLAAERGAPSQFVPADGAVSVGACMCVIFLLCVCEFDCRILFVNARDLDDRILFVFARFCNKDFTSALCVCVCEREREREILLVENFHI